MGRDPTTPRTARALAAFLAEHPLVWVCGLPGAPSPRSSAGSTATHSR